MNKNTVVYQTLSAYSDCHSEEEFGPRDLNFKATAAVYGPYLLLIMGRAVPNGYNAFEVERSLGRLVAACGPKAKYYIAREGSVCIYVKVPKGVCVPLRCTNADEVSLEVDGTLRFWWD
jgi:hypothetical protein